MRKGVFAMICGLFLAMVVVGPAVATKDVPSHDFTGAGFSDSDNCAFCHTPKSAGDNDPKWNEKKDKGRIYAVYNTPGTDGDPSTPQGVSLACLACHDGTIAVDSYTDRRAKSAKDADDVMFDGDLSVEHPVSVVYDTSINKELMPKSVVATLLPLYGANLDQVQCGTCHDPHIGAESYNLLRIPNDHSDLCMACHLK